MAEIPNKPITRKETYLAAIAGQNVDLPPYPITREEAYLDEIAKNGGGGGGGTTDYLDLTNKPQINGNTLTGNKLSGDLGIPNIFQGTIAEWNALTTAEKKAYDHASIPDSIDGGVTFPANKVVMTGGGNVEDAITNLVKTEIKQVAVTSDANHVVMLGISKPNVVVNVEISGVIVLGYTTYANEWLCSLADYSGAQITSGTYTATIYYI